MASTPRFWSPWLRLRWRDGESISAVPDSTCASSAPTPAWQRWLAFRGGPSASPWSRSRVLRRDLRGWQRLPNKGGGRLRRPLLGTGFSAVLRRYPLAENRIELGTQARLAPCRFGPQ